MEVSRCQNLVRDFEEALPTRLRGATGGDYLKLRVPDTEPVTSMTNMAEDAQFSSLGAIHLRVPDTVVDQHSAGRPRTWRGSVGEH